MKEKKLSKKIRRSVSALMAVVLVASVMGPMFSVISSAGYLSFDYIESIKQKKKSAGSDFTIYEIAPESYESTMTYYSDNINNLDLLASEQSSVVGTSQRTSNMNAYYNSLVSKGIIGTGTDTPATNVSGYQEYFPWNNVSGTTELKLDHEEAISVTGAVYNAVKTSDGEDGAYKMNASYRLATNLFDFSEYADTLDTYFANHGTGSTYSKTCLSTDCGDGDSLELNRQDKTITVTQDGADGGDLHTLYGGWESYYMPVQPNTTYRYSFDVEANGGNAQLFVFAYGYSMEGVGYTADAIVFDGSKNYMGTGSYSYEFTTNANTHYLQIRFGTASTTASSATFSNIWIGDKNDYDESIDHFEYVAAGTTGAEGTDYYYDLKFTPIMENDWDDISEGAIYEKATDSSGNEYYICVGVISDDDILELDDPSKMDGGYYRAEINTGVYKTVDDKIVSLPTVVSTADEYHRYHAIPVYTEDGYATFEYAGTAKGYFSAADITYTYVGTGGNYNMVIDPSVTTQTTNITDTVYFKNGLQANKWFRKNVLECYEGDGYNFVINTSALSPDAIKKDEADLVTRFTVADMIVISMGTGLKKADFTSDISDDVYNAIINAASEDYKIPIVVDINVLNTSQPNLKKLATALLDCSTAEGTAIKGGGVVNNIYAFDSADVPSAKCIAGKGFNSDVTPAVGETSTTSGYYDVWSEINDENTLRSNYGQATLTSEVSEAHCMRSIINYAGKRQSSALNHIDVLELEPYTNQTALTCLQVINWFPEKTFFVDKEQTNPVDTEAEAEQFVTITTMSTTEFLGHNEDVIETYDMVYVGSSTVGMNTKYDANGNEIPDYNDDTMDGMYYTNIGDTYQVGNVSSSWFEGSTLAGLLREDYHRIVPAVTKYWTIYQNYDFELRTSGNDITEVAMEKLEEFADAGFPVIYSDDFVEQPISGSYSVNVRGYSKFRREYRENVFHSYETEYFVYFVAEINGDKIPTGVTPVFTWYWSPQDPSVSTEGSINLSTFKNSDGELEEPQDAVKSGDDTNGYKWYSTMGHIYYNGVIYGDGMTMIDPGQSKSGGRAYQSEIGYGVYYCVVTFTFSDTVSEAYKNAFQDVSLTSNRVKTQQSTKSFTVYSYQSNSNGNGDRYSVFTGDIRDDAGNWIIPKPVSFYHDNDDVCGSGDYSSETASVIASCKTNFGYTPTDKDYIIHMTCSHTYKSWGQTKYYQTFVATHLPGDDKDGEEWDDTDDFDCWFGKAANNGKQTKSYWYIGIVDTGVKIEPTHVEAVGHRTVLMESVDNASYMYQFMSKAYDEITYSDAEIAKGYTNTAKNRNNVFAEWELKSSTIKNRLATSIQMKAPTIEVNEATLVSYPHALSNNTLSVDFAISNEADTTKMLTYSVYLYIDTDHDSKFTEDEKTTITSLRENNATVAYNNLKTTTGSGYPYTLERQLPSSYMGILNWQIKVVTNGKESIHDTYTGYAYINTTETTEINALQILPADWWSNPDMKGAWTATGRTDYEGNTYQGSVFLGDNSGADAFWCLTQGSDSRLGKTTYLDDEARQHVVFWVNYKSKTDNGDGTFTYNGCDFKLDIALTDIYEVNTKYEGTASENTSYDDTFLDQYDMLILGFGDSYGHTSLQNKNFFGLVSVNLGFSEDAALAITHFVEEDGKPVLFCHDTTNGNCNFLNYVFNTWGSKIVSFVDDVTDWVVDKWNRFKAWVKGETYDAGSEEDLEMDIQDSRIKDGYYNNLLLRDCLNLDRYGITYSIKSNIDFEGEDGETDYKAGHAYTYILNTKYNSVTRTYSGEDSGGTLTQSLQETPYAGNPKMTMEDLIQHNFSIVYKPGSALYTTTDLGYKVVEYQTVEVTDNTGTHTTSNVVAENDKYSQGFTSWEIVRYGHNCDEYLLPNGVTDRNSSHDIVQATQIAQVNKGTITTYPYDVNTSEFGGTTGVNGKINVRTTHEQYYQCNVNGNDVTVWYTLAGGQYDNLPKDCANSYYIYTSGNITYTGAGHSNVFTTEEAKLFINTLIAAYRVNSEKPSAYFRNEEDSANISYKLITSETNKDDSGNTVTTYDDAIVGFKVINPNLSGGKGKSLTTTVKFYSDANLTNEINIDLYTDSACTNKATTIESDKLYYFNVPDAAKTSLTGGATEYKIYAVAVSKIGDDETKSNAVTLTYRTMGLYELS